MDCARQARGIRCTAAMIACNVALSALKFLAGAVSGSAAITADAANNLTDGASSLVALIGFKMAGKRPDARHPFGHGRIEYIAALVVSFCILLTGIELLRVSAERAIRPEPIETGLMPMAAVILSIAAKCLMSLYAKRTGKKIASAALEASARDSLADALSSLAVLISLVLARIFPHSRIPFDGAAGILIAAVILCNGIAELKKTVDPLIGVPADSALSEKIRSIVLSHKPISGLHDLVIHDYGAGRAMISLHAEVPAKSSIEDIHKVIDAAENDIMLQTGCQAVIHMDPVDLESPAFIRARGALSSALAEISPELSFHDLQITPDNAGTTLSFDLVRPEKGKQSQADDAKLRQAIDEKVKARLGETVRCLVRIEEAFS